MKCTACDGRGYFPLSNIAVKICDRCNGTGEIQQTEQEWLQTASTEQLADVLLRFYYQDFCMNTKRRVIGWLKQPHKE